MFIITGRNKSALRRDISSYHPATLALAAKFRCGCGRCDMELLDCTCSDLPEELAELLTDNITAKTTWEKLSRSQRRILKEYITAAKLPATRQRRAIRSLLKEKKKCDNIS